ncbi:hypothetical protein AMAG_08022 [Allomyces macrogynus ATCC 38327]|uniref:Uncharacterized protein n=1 Tax=Allomyces macrogynus (strain ATCC 38327) TaxID=578462 RepID=A0A0L0SK29_ALLM3|nr:hypothetical protein AMAG_08022 [Allomyces macrogynus ATCC 38327]|eukprot:KNE62842.1 hypothetical protein AMAG_08022 [Allomyces macrogynus ATCC 38327]
MDGTTIAASEAGTVPSPSPPPSARSRRYDTSTIAALSRALAAAHEGSEVSLSSSHCTSKVADSIHDAVLELAHVLNSPTVLSTSTRELDRPVMGTDMMGPALAVLQGLVEQCVMTIEDSVQVIARLEDEVGRLHSQVAELQATKAAARKRICVCNTEEHPETGSDGGEDGSQHDESTGAAEAAEQTETALVPRRDATPATAVAAPIPDEIYTRLVFLERTCDFLLRRGSAASIPRSMLPRRTTIVTATMDADALPWPPTLLAGTTRAGRGTGGPPQARITMTTTTTGSAAVDPEDEPMRTRHASVRRPPRRSSGTALSSSPRPTAVAPHPTTPPRATRMSAGVRSSATTVFDGRLSQYLLLAPAGPSAFASVSPPHRKWLLEQKRLAEAGAFSPVDVGTPRSTVQAKGRIAEILDQDEMDVISPHSSSSQPKARKMADLTPEEMKIVMTLSSNEHLKQPILPPSRNSSRYDSMARGSSRKPSPASSDHDEHERPGPATPPLEEEEDPPKPELPSRRNQVDLDSRLFETMEAIMPHIIHNEASQGGSNPPAAPVAHVDALAPLPALKPIGPSPEATSMDLFHSSSSDEHTAIRLSTLFTDTAPADLVSIRDPSLSLPRGVAPLDSLPRGRGTVTPFESLQRGGVGTATPYDSLERPAPVLHEPVDSDRATATSPTIHCHLPTTHRKPSTKSTSTRSSRSGGLLGRLLSRRGSRPYNATTAAAATAADQPAQIDAPDDGTDIGDLLPLADTVQLVATYFTNLFDDAVALFEHHYGTSDEKYTFVASILFDTLLRIQADAPPPTHRRAVAMVARLADPSDGMHTSLFCPPDVADTPCMALERRYPRLAGNADTDTPPSAGSATVAAAANMSPVAMLVHRLYTLAVMVDGHRNLAFGFPPTWEPNECVALNAMPPAVLAAVGGVGSRRGSAGRVVAAAAAVASPMRVACPPALLPPSRRGGADAGGVRVQIVAPGLHVVGGRLPEHDAGVARPHGFLARAFRSAVGADRKANASTLTRGATVTDEGRVVVKAKVLFPTV